MPDAIMVFGGGITVDGVLEENSRVRVRAAIGLWEKGLAPTILMSGAWSSKDTHVPQRTEAQAMVEYAQELGCPSDHLLKEERSRETIGNAYFCKTGFAIPNKWRELIIVVADYHVPRTTMVCNKVFGPKFHFRVESAPMHLPAEEREKRDLFERAMMSIYDSWLNVEPGNHQLIWEKISKIHPAYARNPKYSREELDRMIMERMALLQQTTVK